MTRERYRKMCRSKIQKARERSFQDGEDNACGVIEENFLNAEYRAVSEYCWLCRLVLGMAQKRGPSVFPIDLQTVLGDALRLSPSTVGSPDWFQE